jgi:NAD(P)-dependent dehydrogenase (short-subunit alcohol dehydrogenase family)
MDIQNKVAVITGVSKGIGYSTAKALLDKGATVFGLGRNNTIEHPNYTFISCDVRSHQEVQSAFEVVYKQTGRQIHILLNNAGLGYFGMLEETPLEQWHEMFDTNVNGTFYCCREALPVMKEQQYGHIINHCLGRCVISG